MIWWVWCFYFCVLRDGLFIAAVNSLYQYDFVCKDESKRILYQCWSPRAYLQWWGCSGLCLWHKPTKLAHSFLFCSCVCFCLYGPFNCISFHKFPQQLFAFSFCCCINFALFVLSTIYLFMKVSLSPHIILCGWLGLKHQLTKYQCAKQCWFVHFLLFLQFIFARIAVLLNTLFYLSSFQQNCGGVAIYWCDPAFVLSIKKNKKNFSYSNAVTASWVYETLHSINQV